MIVTVLLTLGLYAVYFQAVGPATSWVPFGGQPLPGTGPWGLVLLILGFTSFGIATVIQVSDRWGYVKKPKLVVEQ